MRGGQERDEMRVWDVVGGEGTSRKVMRMIDVGCSCSVLLNMKDQVCGMEGGLDGWQTLLLVVVSVGPPGCACA